LVIRAVRDRFPPLTPLSARRVKARQASARGSGAGAWRRPHKAAIDLAGEVLLFATVSCNKPPLRQHSAVSPVQAGRLAIRRHETPLSPGLQLPDSNLCELSHFGESISFSHTE
jgi:hypothetical protein